MIPPGLVSALVRTRRALARGRPGLPYKLELFVTWRCPSRCGTCTLWRRAPGVELTAAEWQAVVGSLAPHLLWLSVTGGEPSMRADLGELLVRTTRAAPRLAYLNLSSNGLRPDALERALATLLEHPGPRVAITLSLDGLGAEHDRLRGVPGGFERVLETARRLQLLRARRPRLAYTFQVTLSAANRARWTALARFARERSGGLSPVFSPASDGVLLTGEAGLGVDLRRSAAEALPQVRSLRDALPCRHPEDVVTRHYLGTLPDFLASGRAPVPCTAGYASWSLEPDGTVRRCDSLAETLGHVRDVGLDLARLPATPGFGRAFAELPDCRACWTPCQAYPSLLASPWALYPARKSPM
jgi:MoaA/NifB/PqqE/SkfB family radical SAM enzyme